MSTKPIDASQLTFRYSGTAGEHYEYDRDTQKRAKDMTRHKDTGYLLWKVRCVAVYGAGGEHGEITVPATDIPTADVDAEIMLSGPIVKDWSINGNQGQTWHAESFAVLALRHPGASTPASAGAKKAASADNG